MNEQALITIAKNMVALDKGLLAIDESNGTCNKRFAEYGIPQTESYRRDYRDLIIGTPNLGNYISGLIVYDETFHQNKKDGTPFRKAILDAGILLGIKVDLGTKDLAGHSGEKVTEGLDGLRERLEAYFLLGARFAKWRAVITPGFSLPTRGCIEVNAQSLARYAALCQESGLVPVVEIEVLMDGEDTIDQCYHVTEQSLRAVFDALYLQNVMLEGIILKPNMILPGLTASLQESNDHIAEMTLKCFLRNVPAAGPGIVFLSGWQSSLLATARLNAMHLHPLSKTPWEISFSFARAIQQPALEIWKGKDSQVVEAQEALLHRAKCNYLARRGEYIMTIENQKN